jgi:hypothetical protein
MASFLGLQLVQASSFPIYKHHESWMTNSALDWGDMLQITVKNSLQDNGQVFFWVYTFCRHANYSLERACTGMELAKFIQTIWMGKSHVDHAHAAAHLHNKARMELLSVLSLLGSRRPIDF